MPLVLPVPTPEPLFAVGPHLKSTFTLAQGEDAFVSQHVGDLENLETLAHFEEALARFRSLFRIEPRCVVRDFHPGYLSTRIAEESGLAELPAVQHHHAHVAAVLGEHDVMDKAIGLAFDGTGYGTDGCIWGFELLEADLRGFERLAHLRYAPLPGGDLAARAPWRSLLGYASLEDDDTSWAGAALSRVSPREVVLARQQAHRHLNAPLASSLGRLFDAAAAVIGTRIESAYEGQAAMELEAAAGSDDAETLPFPVRRGPGLLPTLDPVPLLAALASERARGASVQELSARFHATIAAGAAGLAVELARDRGLERAALAGGCFQNALLLRSVERRLEDAGLEVLVPVALGPNDGAISYGQAVVAAARLND
jgi:hydrogenase maturation protein HypF